MNKGTVVFSLDFELGWGHRSIRPSYVRRLRSQENQLHNEIKGLINLFEKYEIPATWAVVGSLVEPGDDEVFHAPNLFEYLLDTQTKHEIGLHSYRHTPYNQLSVSAAQSDLSDGVNALQEWGEQPQSFIFPRNKIAHLDLLRDRNIRAYREEQDGFWSSLPRSLLRPATFIQNGWGSPPVRIPSSMYLAARRPSPYRWRYALQGLNRAKRKNEMVHYWVHPHNIVTDTSLFSEMENLFKEVRSVADRGNIQILTMSQITDDYLS